MRRGLLTLLVLLGASSTAWAQIQFLPAQRTETRIMVSAGEVVARVMTFDQNNDGRVGIGELSERMRPLVSRGDRNGDEALDRSEVLALAVAPVTQTSQRFTSSGGYAFGDDVGLSSKKHIEGALDDLRLTADRKERALPIVQRYIEQVESLARADLLGRMETLLSPQQFAAFTRALEIQERQVTFRGNAGAMAFRLAVGVGNLNRRVDGMALGPQKTEQAHAAIDDYKTRVRLGRESDRSELLAQLKDVLGDEERENYGAALQRRPVVANSFPFTMALNGAVPAIREQNVTVPAVLIERSSLEGASRR